MSSEPREPHPPRPVPTSTPAPVSVPALPAAEPRWLDGGGVASARFADVYFSAADAVAESRHVFLAGNNLPQAWRQPAVAAGLRPFVIGELGFGSGRNFVTAWGLWRAQPPGPHARLHVLSVEGFPLRPDELAQVHERLPWGELAPLAAALRAAYAEPLPGMQRLLFDDGRVTLTLLHGEAAAVLAELQPPAAVDAWFLDGFAPARNPEMWRPAVCAQVARLSRPAATLATYSVAGAVRRHLQAAGFAVHTAPGHGPKREMLRGRLAEPGRPAVAVDAAADTSTAAQVLAVPRPTWPAGRPRRAVVVGGGLAGCAAAHALTQRGWHVTILERQAARPPSAVPPQTAQHALHAQDAAAVGLLMPRLDVAFSVPMRIFVAGNRFTWQTLARLTAAGHAIPHARCGVLHLAVDATQQQRYARIAAAGIFDPAQVHYLPAAAAAEVAGIPLEHPALWVAEAGWVEPRALCAALAAGATVRHGRTVASLRRRPEHEHARAAAPAEASGTPTPRWHVLDADGQRLATADVVVLANAAAARALAQAAWLPLRPVRGQVTRVAPTPTSAALRCALAYGGYATPVLAGRHLVGATYEPVSRDVPPAVLADPPPLQAEAHAANVELLRRTLPAAFGRAAEPDACPAASAAATTAGRAGVRATTPDRLPVVGPLVARDAFAAAFADALRHGPRRTPAAAAVPYEPGLYALLGLGSRGLATALLAGELLAAQIDGEPGPLERDAAEAMLPQRFLVRELRRQPQS